MIIQRYHSKGKTSICYLLSWVLHLYKGFTIWSEPLCLVLIAWLFSHSQTSYNSIENLPMIVSEIDHLLVGFESRVSSSIRCEIYLSWIWISIFDSGSFRTGLYMRIFHLIWSCLSSVFSMDLSYKCLRISCRLWLISWFVSWLLEVFILTCLNKAWVFFLRISIL